MSNVSGASAEFDFWEFVSCGICHLEFIKESGTLSSVPFWLTECGHVLCNAHLSPDQSCAACGSPGIQLIPLQQELEPPMSNWFNSVPTSFDTVAYSLRFQMTTMANLVRYFKKKYQQYRPLYDRLKEEHAEMKRLKRLVEQLQQENQQLRQRFHIEVSDGAARSNANGKRLRVEEDGYHSVTRTSSPHSSVTPLVPDRLTLPPGRHQPQFNSRQASHVPDSATAKRNIERYAYVPPRSAQLQTMAMPTLSHAQQGSSRRVYTREESNLDQNAAAMPPPPLPTVSRNEHRPSVDSRAQMRPPPTPQVDSGSAHLPQRPSFVPASGGSQRFIPQPPSKATASVPTTPRAFVPSPHYANPADACSRRFVASGSTQRPPGVTAGPGSFATSGAIPETTTRTGSVSAYLPSARGAFS
ncbi:hypothetical protein BD413DRAFT_501491 [Trametes elegans]|nr:hypothetical protein BD413DRAFT_501491 [Trametes elegans]